MNQVPRAIDLHLLDLRRVSALSPFGTTLSNGARKALKMATGCVMESWLSGCIHFVYLDLHWIGIASFFHIMAIFGWFSFKPVT